MILAGGESRRMKDTPKANLILSDRTFLETIEKTYISLDLSNIRVVTGRHHNEIIKRHKTLNVSFIQNMEYRKGQLSSIKLVLDTLGNDIEAALIHPVDQPLVKHDTIKLLIEKFSINENHLIYIPKYKNKRGHPVIFRTELFDQLRKASLDIGAREVVWNNPDRILEIPVGDSGIIMNINTPDDYRKIT